MVAVKSNRVASGRCGFSAMARDGMHVIMGFELKSLIDGATGFDMVIDVRSPSEYAEDHVPGAVSMPVLSDAERARVGTVYTQESAFKARKVGAALVARNSARHIEGPLAKMDGGWRPLVYCWRGGQRSASFASILSQIGWRAETVDGGYSSYRRLVVQLLYDTAFPSSVVLLDGNTGTAKTEVLNRAAAKGAQAINLEGLANHRGSVLGGQGKQPSQKWFESCLAAEVAALDPDRPVVIEAESSKVGRLNIPPRVFEAMKVARRIRIEAPVRARACYLTQAYQDLVSDKSLLLERLDRLRRLQGRERVAHWKALAEAGSYKALAEELIRDHYDPRYAKVRGRRSTGPETVIAAERLGDKDLDRLAGKVGEMVSEPGP